MLKVLAINGGPRKKCNTATILEHVLQGAKEALPDAQCELVNLYEHAYKGCVSCFECKRIGGPSYGKCAVKDGLTDILARSLEADCLVFGTPIYFSDVTGELRCYWERLFFPNLVYDKSYSSIAPKKIHTAFVYTMNVPESMLERMGYPQRFKTMQDVAARMLGHEPLVQYVCDTWQFRDYAKYKSDAFSPQHKAEVREKQFPLDCEKARQMGKALANAASV